MKKTVEVLHDLTGAEVKIKDEERLLFIEIRASHKNIKEEEYILLKREDKTVKYLVYNIKYSDKHKFTANLIFVNYL